MKTVKSVNRKSFWLSVAIKVTVFVVLIWALYKQVYQNEQVHQIPEQLFAPGANKVIPILLLLIFGMFCNWGLEAAKWLLVMRKLTPLRFIRAFKAVWTGVTLGLFTPNRVGEFGGRILYVPRKHRVRAAIVSLIGSFSQNLITVAAGMFGAICYLLYIEEAGMQIVLAVLLLGSIAIILLLLAYYNLEVVVALFRNNRFLKRVYSYTTVLQEYSQADLSRLLGLAFLRYLVYTAQYLIFLNLFGAGLDVVDGFAAITLIFLAQTVVPSFAIADLLTRLPVAALILTEYGVPVQVSLAATTSIWILNLIIPAVLGYIFIIRYNIFKNRQS